MAKSPHGGNVNVPNYITQFQQLTLASNSQTSIPDTFHHQLSQEDISHLPGCQLFLLQHDSKADYINYKED